MPTLNELFYDGREERSGVPKYIKELTDATKRVNNQAADYMWAGIDGTFVAVERKAAQDFVNSLRKERGSGRTKVVRQLYELFKIGATAVYLIVEGILPSDTRGYIGGRWSPLAIERFLLRLTLRHVHVIKTSDQLETASLIYGLWKLSQEESSLWPKE